jgi:hypothetical protein
MFLLFFHTRLWSAVKLHFIISFEAVFCTPIRPQSQPSHLHDYCIRNNVRLTFAQSRLIRMNGTC